MQLCKGARTVTFTFALGVCAAVLALPDAAHAASCTALKSELRRLQAAPAGQSAAAKKWTGAKRQQQKAITAAQRDAGYLGCARASTPQCKSLTAKLKRMKRNLAAIDRQLAKSGAGKPSGTARRIRQISSAMQKQNCNAPASTREARAAGRDTGAKPRSIFQRLFNPEAKVELAKARAGDREIRTARKQTGQSSTRRLRLPSGGKFRTLCVRTCDGYFFPLSVSAGKDQFVNDEARCSEICPASPTELYVYRNPGSDRSQMMSLAGTLYADQPFAYRYKSEFVEDCSCRSTGQTQQSSAWTEISASSTGKVFFSDISAGVPQRTLQPSRGSTYEDGSRPSPLSRPPLRKSHLPFYEDPDTLFNLEKGFDVTASLRLARKQDEVAGNDDRSLSEPGGGLPLLSMRSRQDDDDPAVVSASPVFKSNDRGFRQADDRKQPVRVVGPEYFVAQ